MYATRLIEHEGRGWLYLSPVKNHDALSPSDLHHCAILHHGYSTKLIEKHTRMARLLTVRPFVDQLYRFVPHYRDRNISVRCILWYIPDLSQVCKRIASSLVDVKLSYRTTCHRCRLAIIKQADY